MYKKLIQYFSTRFLSKWVVLLFDILTVLIAFQFAYLVRFGFDYAEVEKHIHTNQSLITLLVFTLCFYIFKSFSGIIRHSGLDDALKLLKASISGGVTLFVLSQIIVHQTTNSLHVAIPTGVIIIHSLSVLMATILSRVFVRGLYRIATSTKSKRSNVAIYGAGAAGIITKSTLQRDKVVGYNISCFIDDNNTLNGKFLDGIRIISPAKAFGKKGFLQDKVVAEVIIAIEQLPADKKNEIVEKCLESNIKVRTIPSVEKWVNGELSVNQIKDVKIEDLLERPAIVLDNHYTKKELQDKTILVTGAAGSIGSEISRQLISKEPKKLVLFEQAESPLHELRIELDSDLRKKYPSVEVEYVIGDIRERDLVLSTFEKFEPNVVFHAAAYKHVPLMEEYPYHAVSTNIKGSKNIADAAVKTGVEKFVMVSTDKAVNPTNVMGASKRIAEIYIQALSKLQSRTKFITTRFGNVLGSNGSVIPLFKKQIENGGPITVTHKEITRYFMTIPEACQLVLEAGTMGQGGEIFIFDMGESVKIFDVAKKMIKLSGFKYPEEIDIVFSGLRPGEKLYEELLATKEGTIKTYHPKIKLAKTRDINFAKVSTEIDELVLINNEHSYDIVRKMKQIVPEFKSNNSVYEELDKEFKVQS